MNFSEISKHQALVERAEEWLKNCSEDVTPSILDAAGAEAVYWWVRGASGGEGPDGSVWACIAGSAWGAGYAYWLGRRDAEPEGE